MKKHDCYIKTNSKVIIGGYSYFYYPVNASEKEGFIKDPGYPSRLGVKYYDRLGAFYGSDSHGKQKPSWWWKLYAFDEKDEERISKQHFSDKTAAIASLKKALNRKGYKLATPYTWPTPPLATSAPGITLNWVSVGNTKINNPNDKWEADSRGNGYFTIEKQDGRYLFKHMRPRTGLPSEVLNNNGKGNSFASIAEAMNAAEIILAPPCNPKGHGNNIMDW